MAGVPENLCCPISLELFEDPISTPCCGQTLSRKSMQDHLVCDDTCPLCRASMLDFPEFDAGNVPRNRTIAGLVDALRAGTCASASPTGTSASVDDLSPKMAAKDEGPKLSCTLTTCQTASRTLPVGRLQVDVEWPSYEGDVCLFMPVIDKSGSMSGQPFEQVKTALMHMLNQTLTNRSVFTCIIPYDSQADIMRVPRDGGGETDRWRLMQARIRNMSAGGGTSFGNAFAKIREVLFGDTSNGRVTAQAFERGTAEFEAQRRLGRQGLLVQGAPAFVKSVVIVFMTDGQDNTRANRTQMVEHLRSILSQWTKHVVVHTVGFSKDHDFKFLDALRKVGREEGTFRFAEPSDGPDALCSKLAELTDSIVSNTCLQLRIDPSPLSFWSRNGRRQLDQPVQMREGFGTLRTFVVVDVTELDGRRLRISVPGRDGNGVEYEVPLSFKGNAEWLEEWQQQLVEEVVEETTALATDTKAAKSLPWKLHLAFLLQRISFLDLCLKGAGTAAQLQLCAAQATAMLRGSEANVARLMDAQTLAPSPTSPTHKMATANSVPSFLPAQRSTANIVTLHQSISGRGPVFSGRVGKSELHKAVLCLSTDAIAECLRSGDPCLTDNDGDSALAVAAAIGRLNAVRILLNEPRVVDQCMKRSNIHGETPLDLAALRGHWNTVKALLQAGAGQDISKSKAEQLLQELLKRGFHKTAATIVNEGLCEVTLETLHDHVPAETLRWIIQMRAEAELMMSSESSPECQRLYLQRGVENGMEELVQRLLGQGNCPDSPDNFEALLLAAGKLADKGVGTRIAERLFDASEEVQAWSLGETLVTAAACGRLPQLELVLSRSATCVDWQDSKGRTALMAACEERQRETIIMLLNHGASCLADNSGCTPLMASSRRNHCAAVAALLGADTPVLRLSGELSALHLCCQLGRPEILEMLLKHVRREETRGRVLGEVVDLGLLQLVIKEDKLECLRVLLAHGALEAPQREPALHCAARVGSCVAARLLFEAGACANERDNRGRTPLHVAVQHGHALVVRLLRCCGTDPDVVDDAGCLATSYCDTVVGAAEAIRDELVDPACELLRAAAACGSLDAACRGVLRFAGLPGLLPARRCLDIHSGDKWTPLMHAVVCGNGEFASWLVESDADLHLEDRNGLSALFWAKALHGQEFAAKLVPQSRCVQGVAVQCKDGELRVSPEAITWMHDNFPPTVALAVSCATLEVTLKAKGFVTLDVAPMETAGRFKEKEVKALATLEAARRRDVRESVIFQCAALADVASFQEDCWGATDARQARAARLQLELDLVPADGTGAQLRELPSSGDLKISVVDFLRRERLPDIRCLERCSLAAVASVSSPHGDSSLSLQQSLLVHACMQEPELLRRVNEPLSGRGSEPWKPLARALLQALRSLPTKPATVFKLLPSEDAFQVGETLSWSGILVASSAAEVTAREKVSATASWTLCCIKTSTCRLLSQLQGATSPERVILPDAVFRVVSLRDEDLGSTREALAGWRTVTLEEVTENACLPA